MTDIARRSVTFDINLVDPHNTAAENSTPVVRRGRKARNLTEIVRLPKPEGGIFWIPATSDACVGNPDARGRVFLWQ